MPHPSHLPQGCPFPQQQTTPLHPSSASLPSGSAAASAVQKKEVGRGNEAEPVDERGRGDLISQAVRFFTSSFSTQGFEKDSKNVFLSGATKV